MARLIGQAEVERSVHSVDFAAVDVAMARMQRYLLFAAILAVPLIVLPESQFVAFTATPKGTVVAALGWLLAAVMSTRAALRLFAGGLSLTGLRTWMRESRVATWVLASALAAGLWPLVSSQLSPFGMISFWGRDPGTGGGAVGLFLYMLIGFGAFWSTAEMRSPRPLSSLVALSVGVAGLIGAAQYFGFAPFGISNTSASFDRISGTAGNPIFFGALLAVGVPLILAHRDVFERRHGRLNWMLLGIAVAATVVLAIAMTATVSRGPWLGVVSGLAVAMGVLTWLRGARYSASLGAVVAVPAIATILAMSLASGPRNDVVDDAAEPVVTTGTFDRIGSTGSVERRLRYWSIGLEMAFTRPDIPFSGSQGWAQSFLFGYGPDTARYVLALEADPDLLNRQFTTLHNDPLNRLLEQGMIGFLAWVALWGAIAFGCVQLVRRARNSSTRDRHPERRPELVEGALEGSAVRTRSMRLGLLAAGLAGAFTARFVEQLTGLPMPGDQVIFWVLVGVLAAVVSSGPHSADSLSLGERAGVRVKPVATDTPAIPRGLQLTIGRQAGFAGAAAVIAIAGIFMAWDRGVEYLAASHNAAILNSQKTVTYSAAVESLVDATSMAPDVIDYHITLADVYRDAATNPASGQEPVETLRLAYDEAMAAYEANPYELTANFRLAQASWDLALAGVPDKGHETVAIYERIEALAPNHPLVAERLPALRAALEPSES